MAGHKLRVLLVDDEPAVRVMLRRWLTRRDLVVCALAATAEQALAAARLHRPDAIVLDHRLPDVPGLQLLPELRRLCPTARIVLFTADSAVAGMAAADGAIALVKGGALSDLYRTLTAAPRTAAGADQLIPDPELVEPGRPATVGPTYGGGVTAG